MEQKVTKSGIMLLLKKILLFLLIVSFIISCGLENSNERQDDEYRFFRRANKDYLYSKSFFENDLVKHFPDSLSENYITYSESKSPEAGLIRLDLICKLNLIEYNHIKHISKALYLPSDTCLLIVNRFANRENYSFNIKINHKDSLKINNNCYQEKLPIPNFWYNDYTTNDTDCRLPKDFEIFVIDAKSGIFLDKKLLTDGRYMPNEWKNGFTRGVAISIKRNVIIYWLLIW